MPLDSFLQGIHLIVALSQIVYRGYRIDAVRVNLLAANGAGKQFAAICYLHADAAAHAFASDGSNVPHQFEQIGSFHLQHHDAVLEGRDEHDVTATDDALGHVVTQATHVDEPHVRRF